MSAFYVGQRVRIARKPSGPTNAPKIGIKNPEATIVGVRFGCKNWPEGGYFLSVDGLGTLGTNGNPIWCEAQQLEPLTTPPALVSWEHACFDRDGSYKEGTPT